MNPTIAGVQIKKLVTHRDQRGFFREIIRSTDGFFADGFGQLSHSLVNKGVLKAWHAHRWQSQWNYVVTGKIHVALHDARPESPTYRSTMEFEVDGSEEAVCYFFPRGVLHGYFCLEGPMSIIYVTSGTYDLTDEIRLPEDDSSLAYVWGK